MFATFTYNEADLPSDAGLDKDEFTKFWKRLRKAADRKLRYYACGEYGERNGRPHYHAIIFGVAPWERDLLTRSWGHGQVFTGTVTMQSARYTADYVGKAVTGVKGASIYKGRTPPFAVMSLGIGRGFVDSNRDQILSQGFVTVGGKPVGFPRYYRTRLGVGKEKEVCEDLTVLEGEREMDAQAVDRLLDSKEQQAKNLAARTSLRKKGSM